MKIFILIFSIFIIIGCNVNHGEYLDDIINPYIQVYGHPEKVIKQYNFIAYYWNNYYLILNSYNWDEKYEIEIEHQLLIPLHDIINPYLNLYGEPGIYDELFYITDYSIDIKWLIPDIEIKLKLDMLHDKEWEVL